VRVELDCGLPTAALLLLNDGSRPEVVAAMDRNIIEYYDRLAPRYDVERFGHAYGRFLDAQERAIISRLLPRCSGAVLELGCGTGRLTDFATVGSDASLASIGLAARRFPQKSFVGADALALSFRENSFDAAFSFHVFMHLEAEAIRTVFAEVARVLKPGGVFIADVASRLRRRILGRGTSGWHGSTSLTQCEFGDLGAPAGLKLRRTAGVALIPIHRIPSRYRSRLAGLDSRLASMAPDCASYLVGCFVKE
jgi:SAM-dependent methyltransferase